MAKKFIDNLNEIIQNRTDLRYKPKIELNDISISNQSKIIGDLLLPPYKLRKLVFSNFFPISTAKKLSHYTTLGALEGIIDSNSVWLTSLSKRFSEGEFDEFYRNNNLTGYRDKVENGTTLAESIVHNAYYLSLSNLKLTSDQKQFLWNVFAKNHSGVRIDFKIKVFNHALKPRKIYYCQDNRNQLITELSDLAQSINKIFVFRDLATAGFYNLCNDLSIENETRIVLKENQATELGLKIFTPPNSKNKVIELKLDKNPLCDIKIDKVTRGKNCDKKEYERIMKKL
jgi:hypothetical protein